jgi:GR25 family glycosyltransferase involved in LPS biosynthesis
MIIDLLTYINLDSRIDKYYHTVHQLYNFKNKFRTQGIVCDNFFDYPIIDEIKYNLPRYKGTIGCFLAHKKALTELMIRSDPNSKNYVMVVEDDVLIHSGFWKKVESLYPPQNHDIIFFDSMRIHHLDYNMQIQENLWPIYADYPVFCGAFCYAISIQNLPSILNILNSVTIYNDFDRFIYCYPNLQNLCYKTDMVSFYRPFTSDRDPTHSWMRAKND